jgi:TPP-dependent pyruvate/acetoin dehydrogenase alpha subunit
MARDPIVRQRNFLVREEILTEAEADDVVEEVKAMIDDAVEFARVSPAPAAEMGIENVFASGPVEATQLAQR